MHTNSILRDKRGTSLIEILVVMVVLLVGIMTIIQMFPTGFRVVRAGESKSVATRLAQQELERWKAMTGNIPEAILPIDEAGDILNNQAVGPPFEGWQRVEDSDGNVTYVRGNALCFRQIIGEATFVPAPSYFGTGGGTGFGSTYTVAFSPIDVSRDDNDRLVGLSIKSGDMQRNIRYNEQYVDLKPGNYAVNYHPFNVAPGAFKIAFPRDYANHRIYYVSYSYWIVDNDGAKQLRSVVDQAVTPPDGPWAFQWHTIVPAAPAGWSVLGIEEGSDNCARGFTEHVANQNGHDDAVWCINDPYEFKLADPIIGTIAFNPNGHGAFEYTAYGKRPLQARISYRRYDPRIIREDKVVPAPSDPLLPDADIPMKMSLRFILAIGAPTDNPNEATYQGLITGDILVPLPVYVVDLASGLQVELTEDPYLKAPPDGKLDYKTGIITLPARANLVDWQGNSVQSNVPLSGRQLRFFYRADGDWSVGCLKACSIYTRVYSPDSVTYNTCYLDAPNRLVFAPCQADQTVSVDFTYGPIGGGIEGEHRIVGYADQIQIDAGKWCVYLPLPDVDTGKNEIKRISVSGLSFRARVIWRDGKAWRHVDLDTALSRQ